MTGHRAAQENRSSGEIRRLLALLVPEYTGALETGEWGVIPEIATDAQPFSDSEGAGALIEDEDLSDERVAS